MIGVLSGIELAREAMICPMGAFLMVSSHRLDPLRSSGRGTEESSTRAPPQPLGPPHEAWAVREDAAPDASEQVAPELRTTVRATTGRGHSGSPTRMQPRSLQPADGREGGSWRGCRAPASEPPSARPSCTRVVPPPHQPQRSRAVPPSAQASEAFAARANGAHADVPTRSRTMQTRAKRPASAYSVLCTT